MIISLLFIPLIGVLLLLPLPFGLGQLPQSQNDIQTKINQFNKINTRLAGFDPEGIKAAQPYGINLDSNTLMKKIALFVSLLNLLISIYMWFQFDNSSTTYQFVYEFNSLNFCHFHVGVDGISLYFVLLTTFITPICILSN